MTYLEPITQAMTLAGAGWSRPAGLAPLHAPSDAAHLWALYIESKRSADPEPRGAFAIAHAAVLIDTNNHRPCVDGLTIIDTNKGAL